MPNCPKCKELPLQHSQLETGLPGYACNNCQGALLSLVSYRSWLDTHPTGASQLPSAQTPAADTDESDARKALQCPKCARLLTKYKVQADADNRLDYCAHCEEVWLDAGEWQLLHNLAVDTALNKIFSQPWQRKIVQQQQAQLAQDRHERTFGADWEKIQALHDWLDEHPQRSEILALLSDSD